MRLIWFAVLASACSAAGGDDGDIDPSGDLADEAGGVELESQYALSLSSIVDVQDAESSQTARLVTKAGAVVTVDVSGRGFVLSVQPCYADPPSVAGYSLEIDDAIVQAVPPISIPATITSGDNGPIFQTAAAAILLGASLADPIADSLPEDEDDARVSDPDGDGEPGITTRLLDAPLCGDIEIFAAARLLFSLSADLSSAGEFSGRSELSLDSQIYGDDCWLVDVREQAEAAEAGSVVLSEHNTFTMVALPADTAASCASLQ